MDREDIKAALRKSGSSLTQVAQELEVSRQTVTAVLSGRRSRRVEEGIASRLSLPVAVVWPDRYASIRSENPVEALTTRANPQTN